MDPVEWLSGDRGLLFDWKIATTDDIMYYQLQLQSPEVLNEVINQAEDDTLFWTMPIVCLPFLCSSQVFSSSMGQIPAATQTYMIGAGAGNFTATGVLPNSIVNNSDHVVAQCVPCITVRCSGSSDRHRGPSPTVLPLLRFRWTWEASPRRRRPSSLLWA